MNSTAPPRARVAAFRRCMRSRVVYDVILVLVQLLAVCHSASQGMHYPTCALSLVTRVARHTGLTCS